MTKEQVIVGEGGNITFYNYKAPKEPKDNVVVLADGDTVAGTYIGLTDPSKDKYGKSDIILTMANGGRAQVSGAGLLNKLIAAVEVGTNIEILYKGKSEIKSGQWKGSPAHSFELFKTGAAPAKAAGDDGMPF